MQRLLLLVFLTTIAIDWPQLPLNMRATDVAFIAAALAILGGAPTWTRPRLTTLDLGILVYIIGTAVAVIASPDPATSSIELVRQLYLVAIYVTIAIAVHQGLRNTVGTGLALSGGALAIAGLLGAAINMLTGYSVGTLTAVMTLPYLGETVRVRALTASEAMFACVLAVSIPFALRHPLVASSRARLAVAVAGFGIAAALTFSHSIAGVAVALMFTTWSAFRFNRPLRLAAVVTTILIVLAFNFAASVSVRSIGASAFRDDNVYHYAVDRGRTQIASVAIEYQTMSYLRIKQVAWDAFLNDPLFGIGLDRFHAATEVAFQQGRLTEPYRAIDPHSTFFGRLAEAGIVGGLTLLLLWFAIGRSLMQLLATPVWREWLTIAAAAAIAGTLVNTMNADVMNFRFLWATLGLVRGLGSVTPAPDESRTASS